MDLSDATFEQTVTLEGAQIGGALDMQHAIFRGQLDLTRLQTTGDVSMRCAVYSQPVAAEYAHISGDIDLSGTGFSEPQFERRDRGKEYEKSRRDCGKSRSEPPGELGYPQPAIRSLTHS